MERGLIRRWSTERRLASALQLLRGMEPGDNLSGGRRAELLSELAAELESRDPYTHGHSRRVAHHATMIAVRMGLSAAHIVTIRAAAALHDVGKINTPRAVLHKPGRLTEVEFGLIKLHPVDGAEIVSTLGDPELTAMVRHHHERLDGTGYPDGLEGNEIPLGARIIAVADTFDAITSTRSYRPAKTHERAIEVLEREASSRLDPAGVSAFRTYYAESRPRPLWTPRRSAFSSGSGANAQPAMGPSSGLSP
jgi:putative nucleotidyltransferase with HDIG domain